MQASRRERSWKSVLTVHLDNQRNKKESKDGRSGYRRKRSLSLLFLAFCFFLSSCQIRTGTAGQDTIFVSSEQLELEELPEYEGKPYVEIDEGEPDFSEAELTTDSYEMYSDLDELGRCQSAEACVGTDLMPDKEREDIGQIKPSGWQTIKYDNVDGKYLYNRCHLIGYQLTAENANEKNLITGTRYMNTEGMLPFENEIADYVQDTENHVMYRVTPVFEGNNLVASGVWMEAESVEDNGKGVSFNIYVYNVQPGIEIDYSQGDSREADEEVLADQKETGEKEDSAKETYIINENTDKFHKPGCSSVSDIKAHNKKEFNGSKEELLEKGYTPCKRCQP